MFFINSQSIFINKFDVVMIKIFNYTPKTFNSYDECSDTTGINEVVACLNSLNAPSITHTLFILSMFLGWMLFNAT